MRIRLVSTILIVLFMAVRPELVLASSSGLLTQLTNDTRIYGGKITWSDGESKIKTTLFEQGGQVVGEATYPSGETLGLSLIESLMVEGVNAYLFNWKFDAENYGRLQLLFANDFEKFSGTWGWAESHENGGNWSGSLVSGTTDSTGVQKSQLQNTGLIGSWESSDGERYDILDGFKPNVGGVITYENGEATDVATWKVNATSQTLEIGYSEEPFEISDDGQYLTWGSYSKKQYRKVADVEASVVSNLKEDQNEFLDQLTGFIWETHASDSARIEFTRTFSNTEGVAAQFDKEDKLNSLGSWGVTSNVLKLKDSVYIEARITKAYLIAMDSDDGFIVLRRGEPRQEIARTDLRVAREVFLKELATGAWEQLEYSTTYIYRFRPLETDLKGLRFGESSKKLQSTEVWEYSVATGAMKIGYSEYIGGLLIDDVLVFLDDGGSQEIYHREPTIEKKHFTTVDTKAISVSERTAVEVNDAIARQLSQGDTYFLFEFQSDGRTGYLHRWTSTPFQITGEGLQFADGYTEHEKIYLIEDYIALGDEGFKIDTRTSRLRPKTDAEAVSDATEAKQNLKTLQEGGVKLLLTRSDGSTEMVRLPLKNFDELKSVSLLLD